MKLIVLSMLLTKQSLIPYANFKDRLNGSAEYVLDEADNILGVSCSPKSPPRFCAYGSETFGPNFWKSVYAARGLILNMGLECRESV